MKNFKYLLLLIILMTFSESYAQSALPKGQKQLNVGLGFSSLGVPVYVAGVGFAIHDNITVGPQISYRTFNSSHKLADILLLAATANYHFNTLLNIPSYFDLYAGLTLGYYIWYGPSGCVLNKRGGEGSGLGLEIQIGGRYYFNSKWAINLEFSGGTASGANIGISYKF